jgi:hypothetical protein
MFVLSLIASTLLITISNAVCGQYFRDYDGSLLSIDVCSDVYIEGDEGDMLFSYKYMCNEDHTGVDYFYYNGSSCDDNYMMGSLNQSNVTDIVCGNEYENCYAHFQINDGCNEDNNNNNNNNEHYYISYSTPINMCSQDLDNNQSKIITCSNNGISNVEIMVYNDLNCQILNTIYYVNENDCGMTPIWIDINPESNDHFINVSINILECQSSLTSTTTTFIPESTIIESSSSTTEEDDEEEESTSTTPISETSSTTTTASSSTATITTTQSSEAVYCYYSFMIMTIMILLSFLL